MHIALDCRTITAPKTGDRTYALNLMRALARIDAQDGERSGDEYSLYTWEPTTLTDLGRSNFHPVLLPASPRWTWTPFAFPLDLRRRKADLAHVQYIVPPAAPCPLITTIHDIAFRRYPELFPLKHRLLLNWLIPAAARTAELVLTGSEATRRDLIEFYDLPPDKIRVTPYAADPIYRPIEQGEAQDAVAQRFGLSGPYVLSVGVLQPRKNLPRLVRAFGRIAASVPHRLVLVGKEGWDNEELQKALADVPRGREPIFTGYVADADLPMLYAAADLFVYPSLYEGFGLPPLEAMACGAPVLTSNVSSLPEVVGNAGVTVDPYDVDALAEALAQLLHDPAARAALRVAGLDRAKQFSWDHTARLTRAAYHQVLTGAY